MLAASIYEPLLFLRQKRLASLCLFASSRLIRRLRRHLLPPEKATLRPFLRFVSFVGEVSERKEHVVLFSRSDTPRIGRKEANENERTF